MDITESSFFFRGNTGKPNESNMRSFGEFALQLLHTNAFVRKKEVDKLSNLNNKAGEDVNNYIQNSEEEISIGNIPKNDPIIDIINQLLNDRDAYPVAVRRTIMLLLYGNGFYPEYSDVIRLPADILTKGSNPNKEPVRNLIEMDIAECKMELEDAEKEFLDKYPELTNINFNMIFIPDQLDRPYTFIEENIADPTRRESAKQDTIKLRELWRKVTTGKERNYPLAHFVRKYDIINETTLTKNMGETTNIINRVLGIYRPAILGHLSK